MKFEAGEKIFVYGDKRKKFFGSVIEFLGETHIDGSVYLIEINGKKTSIHERYLHSAISEEV